MKRFLVLSGLLALGGCTSGPPRVPHVAAPAPLPTVVPPPPATPDWADVPLTPGRWRYTPDLATASFGQEGAPPLLLIRCDKAAHRVIVTRGGATVGPMTIRTSYSQADYSVTAEAAGASASFAARDPLLDRIAFSRGRFTIAVPGAAILVLPAWAEPARVVEDCRS